MGHDLAIGIAEPLVAGVCSARGLTIFVEDRLRFDQRKYCRATQLCSSPKHCWVKRLYPKPGLRLPRRQRWHLERRSNPLEDRQSPIHCRGCTAIRQSENTFRPDREAGNSQRGPRRFRHQADRPAVRESRAAGLEQRGIRSLACLPPKPRTPRRMGACGRGW